MAVGHFQLSTIAMNDKVEEAVVVGPLVPKAHIQLAIADNQENRRRHGNRFCFTEITFPYLDGIQLPHACRAVSLF